MKIHHRSMLPVFEFFLSVTHPPSLAPHRAPSVRHSVATVARLLEISSELVLQALQAPTGDLRCCDRDETVLGVVAFWG